MMPLKAQRLRPSHPRRNPHLPHIMRLRRRRIALYQILQLAGKHLPVRIACDTRWRIGWQDEHYGSCDV